jgi:hypothetical protein
LPRPKTTGFAVDRAIRTTFYTHFSPEPFRAMKVVSSIINKTNPRFKARQG